MRFANWSPDATGVDFCLAPRETEAWIGPVLAMQLGAGTSLGNLTVVDIGPPFDAGPAADASHSSRDAGPDALAPVDAAPSSDARETGVSEAGLGISGVVFPRISPYVSVTPGDYSVRVVLAGSADCSSPVLPDADDLPALRAGVIETLALVGDTLLAGADPGLSLEVYEDDTSVAPGSIAVRFINAVPSVTSVSFVSGSLLAGAIEPYVSAAQFGQAGVDTDAGVLDSNDYLILPPITNAVWSLVNANGGVVTLASVEGVGIAAGSIATVVAVGGQSGPFQADVGTLLCTDTTPEVGEVATCKLYAAKAGVCPRCP